jgi:nitroimidazol reductase NimA-like FMN-containing flavoprotein (pyridoxamine 5'-phosphate oxidase superfamily)
MSLRSHAAHPHTTEILNLARAECLRLLAETSFGRLAVNVAGHGPPVIRPVNYVFDQPSQSVAFRTGLGTKLHGLLRTARAAFEIDGIDPEERTGWSVIIHGVAEPVTSPAEVRRLESLGLESWAPGPKAHWVRIRAATVSGRRIVRGADEVPSYRA